MFTTNNAAIANLSVHQVGNKTNDEPLILSNNQLSIKEVELPELLIKYFLTPFLDAEFNSFTFSNDDFSLNPMFNFAAQAFDNPESFHQISINIAKYLYEITNHPQIKSGDLFVVHFSQLEIDQEISDAIGIFKSENKQVFLKLINQSNNFQLNQDEGIHVDKMDKGCLIFNIDKEVGFRVCAIDKSNKSQEAHYWKDAFLNVKPCNDNYHQTKTMMSIAKNFVTKQLVEEFEASKTDQIDLLNRSVAYFKNNENFDKQTFEQAVFQQENIIKSFQKFDEDYRASSQIELEDGFDISEIAVKKQAKNFKSILKLDKNFHIYIHGDRELIQSGMESNGRKFYKIYYEQEA